MTTDLLIPDLFRTEFSKICAVLNTYFQFRDPDLAEDIASATFQAALETWPYKGAPAHPRAWLYRVARNKAINHLRNAKRMVSEGEIELADIAGPEMTAQNFQDSQLLTLFAICDPLLPSETQIGLALRILCGFGIDEIASAFMVNREVINKRLYRGRQRLRESGFDPASTSLIDPAKLDNVLMVLYLMFNEGYHSETHTSLVRETFCMDAIRLTGLLLDEKHTATPAAHALFALMNFQASRLKARYNPQGIETLYDEQDTGLWDQQMITTGAYHLHKSAKGNLLSTYHLEAVIAYWHTQKEDSPEKWEAILKTYDQLLAIQYSPVAALNRIVAFAKILGNSLAIAEAMKLGMQESPYYHLLLGELWASQNATKAMEHYQKAKSIFIRETEIRLVNAKIKSLQ